MALTAAVKAFRASFLAGTSPVEPFQTLIAASKHATPAERDAAVRALLDPAGIEHPEVAAMMVVASGALVEDGASTALGLDAIFDRMADGAELLAATDLGDADLDGEDRPPPRELPQEVRRWVAAWKNFTRGVMARLARDVVARQRLRGHARLAPALRALADRTWANHLRYLIEVLDMLDDEPLHVIDLCAGGRLSRYRALGIRSGFHLMTVLDGQRPFTLAPRVDLVHARHGYYIWKGLAEAGGVFVADDLAQLLWGEPLARSIPRFEGVRTIIKTPLPFARSWDARFIAPVHEALPETVVLEKALSIEESRPILQRIAAAARAS